MFSKNLNFSYCFFILYVKRVLLFWGIERSDGSDGILGGENFKKKKKKFSQKKIRGDKINSI